MITPSIKLQKLQEFIKLQTQDSILWLPFDDCFNDNYVKYMQENFRNLHKMIESENLQDITEIIEKYRVSLMDRTE